VSSFLVVFLCTLNLTDITSGRILAEFIEQEFEDYVQSNILDPLGMTNTGFTFTEEVQSKMAVGYNADGSVADLIDLGWVGPAGQMYSSASGTVAHSL
jgi:CubicO group peptidase (beta-lactamase class C family)